MSRKKLVREKSLEFALRVIKASRVLKSRGCDYALIRQFIRSGTSIGANIAEAHVAFTRAEFAAKLSIALKEGKETEYWITLFLLAEWFTQTEHDSLVSDVNEINRMLYSSIKRLRKPTV